MDALNSSPDMELYCHQQTSIITANDWSFKICGSRRDIVYICPPWGGLRNDRCKVEGDELSKLKVEYIQQAKG